MYTDRRKSSLANDVSISELLYLREKEGLSNKEIAKRLGVGYNNILALIGPQPRRVKDQQSKA